VNRALHGGSLEISSIVKVQAKKPNVQIKDLELISASATWKQLANPRSYDLI